MCNIMNELVKLLYFNYQLNYNRVPIIGITMIRSSQRFRITMSTMVHFGTTEINNFQWYI